jgi:hypothetical protein
MRSRALDAFVDASAMRRSRAPSDGEEPPKGPVPSEAVTARPTATAATHEVIHAGTPNASPLRRGSSTCPVSATPLKDLREKFPLLYWVVI